MRIARVIVDTTTRALDRALDYAVPPELEQTVRVGVPVLVPLGAGQAVGYVIGSAEESAFRLKPLLAVLGPASFDEAAVTVAGWVADNYLSTLADALRLFLPPGGVPRIERHVDIAGERPASTERAALFDAVSSGTTSLHELSRTFASRADRLVASLVESGALRRRYGLARPQAGPVDDRWASLLRDPEPGELRANATLQRAVVEALSEGPVSVPELSAELGGVDGALRRLESSGLVSVERHRRYRRPGGRIREAPRPERLSAGQEEALRTIADTRRTATGVVVVEGVTGSGKTEVYLRAIEDVIAEGRTAIVLVPEISLTPQTVGRFRSRFGDAVAVLHSRLSAGERYDQWELAARGEVSVVVGPRSALFAPLANLGLIVIDEEHDASYKQASAPRYHARDVARRIAEARGAVLVLGSATPSMEARRYCAEGVFRCVRMPERVSGSMPPVTVVDMAREFADGHRSMFSRPLLQALAEVEAAGEKAVLLLNRRGFASFLLCRACGFVPECEDCSVSLTYHETVGRLRCHHCGASAAVPPACPRCGSPYLRLFGAGTQRVESELAAAFPRLSVVRMDADTTTGKGAHEKLLARFEALPGGVLLGTQMIAKGLDYPDVTLVGVVNADTTLHLPDFRAGERTYQLLEQVAGRAGRGEAGGRVFIQTYWPDHPAILAVASRDPSALYVEEESLREDLGYPPFGRLANVLLTGGVERAVRDAAVEVGERLRKSPPEGYRCLGPSPAPLARVRKAWRWHLLVKAPPASAVPAFVRTALSGYPPPEGVTLAVDVDPVDVL
ncbi:MAG TPA: primosomal protein N' [Coriobacteriia bacterium]|jgi:primosomal protein N' (replication factor Y)